MYLEYNASKTPPPPPCPPKNAHASKLVEIVY